MANISQLGDENIFHLKLDTCGNDNFVLNYPNNSFFVEEENNESITVEDTCITSENPDNISITLHANELSDTTVPLNTIEATRQANIENASSKVIDSFIVENTKTNISTSIPLTAGPITNGSSRQEEQLHNTILTPGTSSLINKENCSKVTHVQILPDPSRHNENVYLMQDKLIGEGFQCHLCTNTTMPSSGTLRHHLVTQHNFLHEESHYCNFCERECWSKAQIEYHLRLHHGIRKASLACLVCGTQLSSVAERLAHERKHPLTFECPVCSYKCAARHQLASHVQEHLAEFKPHACVFCCRRFKSNNTLLIHKWRHRKQICSLSECVLTFDDESWLVVHLQNNHKFKLNEVTKLIQHRDIVDSYLDKVMLSLNLVSSGNDEINLSSNTHKEHKISTIVKNLSNIVKNSYLNSNSTLIEIKQYFKKIDLKIDEIDLNSSTDHDDGDKLLKNVLLETQLYRCGLCNIYFQTQEALEQHKSSHDEEVTCKICDRSFRSLKLFRRHAVTHRKTKDTTDYSDIPELNKEKLSSLICAECGKEYASEAALDRHGRSHRRKQGKYECTICLKKFRLSSQVTFHMSKYHKVYSVRQKFCCTLCDKRFISKTFLDSHMIIHGEKEPTLVCQECGKVFLREKKYRQHVAKHGIKYNCPKCHQIFDKEVKLTVHMHTHDPVHNSRYECAFCHLKFPFKSKYNLHLLTHTGEKPYVCEVCGKRFRRLQQCKLHTKYLHGKKNLSCNECRKLFGQKSNMQRHRLMVHYNLRRWVCGLCSLNYAYSQDLRKHLNKEHERVLQPIFNNMKKTMDQIYIFPELGTEAIDPQIKAQIESITAIEKYKFQQIYQLNNSNDASNTKLQEKNKTSETLIPRQIKQVDNNIPTHVNEHKSSDECVQCRSKLLIIDNNLKCQVCDATACSHEHLQTHLNKFHKNCPNEKLMEDTVLVSNINNQSVQLIPQQEIIGQSSVANIQSSTLTPFIPQDNASNVQQSYILPHCLAQPIVNNCNNNSVFLVTPQPMDFHPESSQLFFSNGASLQNVAQANANSPMIISNNGSIISAINGFGTSDNSTTAFAALPEIVENKTQMITIMNGLQLVQPQNCQGISYQNKFPTVQVIPQVPSLNPTSLIIAKADINNTETNFTNSPTKPLVDNSASTVTGKPVEQSQPSVMNDINFPIRNDDIISDASSGNQNIIDSSISNTTAMYEVQSQPYQIQSSRNESSFISEQSSSMLLETSNKSFFLHEDTPTDDQIATHSTSGDSVATVLLALAGSTQGNYNPSDIDLSTQSTTTSHTLQNNNESSFHNCPTQCDSQTTEELSDTQAVTDHRAPITDSNNLFQNINRTADTTTSNELNAITAFDGSRVEVTDIYGNDVLQIPVDLYSTRCDQCGKKFSTMTQLRRHLKVHRKREHVCEICNKPFVEKFNLKIHMLTHTQERPHKCDMCSKRFRYLRDLTDHYNSHIKTRPYSCYVCNVSFVRYRDLGRHTKEQHSQKKFKCEICGAEFKRKIYLETTHMQIHRMKESKSPAFSCTQCDKGFATLKLLDEHLIKDNHKSSYTCKICGRSFNKQRYLTSHLKIHSKKHGCVKCSSCPRVFSTEQDCKIHEENFHSKKNCSNKRKIDKSNFPPDNSSTALLNVKSSGHKANDINSLECLVARYGKEESRINTSNEQLQNITEEATQNCKFSGII